MEQTIAINLSNRHIHLSLTDFAALFGDTAALTHAKDLSQPGQFAAEETVVLKSFQNDRTLDLRVLGPCRHETQCEISLGDARYLHIEYPKISLSGDLEDSLPFIVEGPEGVLEKERGLIIAARHIHLDPTTAQAWNTHDGALVSVRAGEGNRYTTFKNVTVRVSESFVPECHLDFDEGNAAGIQNGSIGIVQI